MVLCVLSAERVMLLGVVLYHVVVTAHAVIFWVHCPSSSLVLVSSPLVTLFLFTEGGGPARFIGGFLQQDTKVPGRPSTTRIPQDEKYGIRN